MTEALVQYNAMRREVEKCVKLDEAAEIRNKAMALEAYYRQHNDRELENWFSEIKVRASVRLGQLLKELEKSPGSRTDLKNEPLSPDARRFKPLKSKTLDKSGIPIHKGARLQALADAAPEAERYYADCKAAKQAPTMKGLQLVRQRTRREEREKALAVKTRTASQRSGNQLFGVILTDPPWRFEPRSRDTGMGRTADMHYPTMTFEELREEEIPAAPDCVMFMWSTVAILSQSIKLLEHYGFIYKSSYGWVKLGHGHGHWSQKDQLELLLVGVRGNAVPAPAKGKQPPQVQILPRRAHSEKPDEFYIMIEQMFPNTPKLEMYARKYRKRWESWGNQLDEAAD